MARPRDFIGDKGSIINCFAYRGDTCTVLTDLYCIKEDYQCPFYKTKKVYGKEIKEQEQENWSYNDDN